MIFQIQKEYKYLAIIIFVFYLGGLYFFPNKFYFFFLLCILFFIANKPYKVRFEEHQFIEIHRLIGKKKIKFHDIKKVTKGTHRNAIIFEGGVIYLGHLIERVDTLTDLIKNSIQRHEVSEISSAQIGEVTKSTEPSSYALIMIAIRVTIAAIILSAIGVWFFIKFVKSF